jgi:hypothetical protein
VSELADQRLEVAELQQWQRNRLKAVEAEQVKLMQAHYADAIPLELLKTEQARLGAERGQLEAALRVSLADDQRLRANAEAAVKLLQNCHQAYRRMGGRERRLMNQAFFEKVWVTEDGIVAWEYAEPFATLMRRHGASEPHVIVEYKSSLQSEADDGLETDLNREITRRSPGRWARAYLSPCLKQNNLAEREGFEPSDPVTQVNSLAVNPIRPLSHLSRLQSLGHPAAAHWRRYTNENILVNDAKSRLVIRSTATRQGGREREE